MKELLKHFSDNGIDLSNLLVLCGAILAALFLLAFAGKFLFGKNSIIMGTISSTFTVLFVYFTAILVPFPILSSPLPFIALQNSTLTFIDFTGNYLLLASHILRFLILAFYAALANQLLPKGKLLWPIYRLLSVAAVLILYYLSVSLISAVLTPVLSKYSAVVLLGLLMLFLATGSLRFLLGVAISTVNPIVAALFTFFFVTVIGKQILKALLVTVIFAAFLLLCRQFGIHSFPVDSISLAIGIPIAAASVIIWYFLGKLQ